MKYYKLGSLKDYITKNFYNIKWNEKLIILKSIIGALSHLHNQKIIHRDFHSGNILYENDFDIVISDLGISKSSLDNNDGKIYGILPYMAPEILQGIEYTIASDIYGFGMIMWEFTTGIPPFNDREHDFYLALSICKGERPEIIENTPQCYIDLMKKCWDQDPSKRPTALEIIYHLNDDEKFKNDVIEFEKTNDILEQRQKSSLITSKIINNKSTTKYHPQADYTSCMFDFISELNETLGLHEGIQNVEELDDAISNMNI